MVLDGDAQDSEAVVPNGVVLDSCFVLEDVVDGLGEQSDEGVAL